MTEFGWLVRAEWTKLRTVPRWMIALGAAIGLTVLVALLTSAGAGSDVSGGGPGGKADLTKPPRGYQDGGSFTYKDLPGDGSLIAHVVSQKDTGAWAKAGLMIRASEDPGAKYAAVMLTPGNGTHMQADFKDKAQGTGSWLKLERTGSTVTGYASADGTAWKKLATHELSGTAHLGLFVATPAETKVVRQFGSESIESQPTIGEAVFDHVSPEPAGWTDRGAPSGPAAPEITTFTWADGKATMAGVNDIGPDPYADDITRTTLTGILIGLVAVIAVVVLFVTTEYRKGMALTTFTITPHRGHVLAARTLVLGTVGFVVGLVGSAAALLLSAPLIRADKRSDISLTDPTVLRAVLCTALLVSLVSIFSLALATLFRNTAAAIGLALVGLLLPQIIATGLPLSAAQWLTRLTPSAAFEAQQTFPHYDTALSPWPSMAVLALYAALTLALATRTLTRRDA